MVMMGTSLSFWYSLLDIIGQIHRFQSGNVVGDKLTSCLGNKYYDLLLVKGKVSAVNWLLVFDLKLQVTANCEAHKVDWMKAGINFI